MIKKLLLLLIINGLLQVNALAQANIQLNISGDCESVSGEYAYDGMVNDKFNYKLVGDEFQVGFDGIKWLLYFVNGSITEVGFENTTSTLGLLPPETGWTAVDCIDGTMTISLPTLVTSVAVAGQGGASTVISESTLQMEATVLPADAGDQTVTWEVTNGTGSASIDANGLLTGGTPGTVTVTASAVDGSEVTGSTVIIIEPLLVASITVNGEGGASTVLSEGTLQMEAEILPSNATNPSITWSVEAGTGTANIDANGLLTGGTPGTVTVTATANDLSGVEGNTEITVEPILVTSIAVNGEGGATNVLSGSKLQMEAMVLPANASDGAVTWKITAGTGTASIDENGTVTGENPGTVTVTATATDGSNVSGSTEITVDPILITSINVTGENNVTTILPEETLQMAATILPADATDQSITWSVEPITGSATIDTNGLLTGGTSGTVTVKASANDGSGINGSIEITVGPILVNSIAVRGEGDATSVSPEGTLQMEATVLPSNASDPSVTWSVETGTGTATIDTNGLLTGGAPGTVTVFATANDESGISGSTEITIEGILVSSITVTGEDGIAIVESESTLQMEATVLPLNATDMSLTWNTIAGTGTATIDETGLVTGSTPGTVTVTATANDGSGISGSVEIVVEEVVGIEELIFSQVKVYPTLTQGILNVDIDKPTTIAIVDIKGRTLLSKELIHKNNVINLERLEQGMYLIQIIVQEGKATKRLVLEK